ncbi:unnamed protein product [Caenorhabditis auriculariae]|uniref:LRRCT domain-containing protein n=1 Tax=Caenorhabditis auriculariae TaxID=2777116 RepID=A0A8S1GV80_9PELO|nr:unnamed protein product [Caenorhabditis auriculariae]
MSTSTSGWSSQVQWGLTERQRNGPLTAAKRVSNTCQYEQFRHILPAVSIVCDKGESLSSVLVALSHPPAVIDSLVISNTPIDQLPDYVFQGFHIKKLILRNNGLRQIHPRTFSGTLENYVSDNAFLSYHSRETIERLDLSANNLTAIHPTGLLGLEKLSQLSLDKNLFQNIPSEALANVPSLEDLSLGVNQIISVPQNSLPLPNLKSLSLEVNQIRHIPSDSFQSLPSLTYLYLGNNLLTSIDPSIFYHTNNLKVLSMGNNKDITTIQSNSFQFVPNLIRLELSDCSLTTIETGALRKANNLQVVILSRNQITHISHDTFSNLPQAAYIDLSNNAITRIEDFAFSQLPMLTTLDLGSNRLETLPENMIYDSLLPKPPSVTRKLLLQNNPWRCDKDLMWLRKWLRDNGDVVISTMSGLTARCWTPAHLNGLDLRQTDPAAPQSVKIGEQMRKILKPAETLLIPVRSDFEPDAPRAHTNVNGISLVGLVLGIVLSVFVLCLVLLLVIRCVMKAYEEKSSGSNFGSSVSSTGYMGSAYSGTGILSSNEARARRSTTNSNIYLNRPLHLNDESSKLKGLPEKKSLRFYYRRKRQGDCGEACCVGCVDLDENDQSSALSSAVMRVPSPQALLIGFLICSIELVASCPQPVAQVCQCADLHNGVILDCSNAEAQQTLQILRTNQALLGLIQSLTMRNAQLKTISPSLFSGLYIKKLDLSYNNIHEVDDHAFDGLSSVLQELILHHNNITKLPVKALGSLPMLLSLDISNNTIPEIGESDILPTMPKLYDINLGSNLINNVHTNTFQNIRGSIQTINLGHNKLNAVPSSAIRGLKQLQSLHLHRNNIKQLEALNFLNLPVLNLLNLAANRITEINRQAFLNVPNLRYLYLTDNQIVKLLPHQFATFDQLEMLDLTNNLIDEIPSECFSQLSQLRQLYLGNNRIKGIGQNAFINSTIVVLVLSGNQLTTVPEGVVTGLSNLQQLSLKANQIKEIHQNAFYNAPSLVMIDLSNNQLQDIAPSTFLAQLNLLLIDLTANKIVRTPYAAFNRRVGTVLLKENPLVCTEKIHMLQDGTGINIQDSEDIVCGGTPKPKLVPTTPSPVQMRKMSPKKAIIQPLSETSVSPSGAFQQAGLVPGLGQLPEAPLTSIRRTPSRFIQDSAAPRLSTSEVPESEQLPSLENVEIPSLDGLTPEMKPIEPIPSYLPTRNEPITTTLGPRLYTDIADNPNLIHPFPVPFLKRGPQLNQSSRVKSSETEVKPVEVHTLPPSILIEPGSTPKFNTTQQEETERFEEFALKSQAKEIDEPFSPKQQTSKFSFPTTIVMICVGTALVVMVAVSVGLCVSRHRHLQRFESSYSESSVARTNDYVAAQARMNSIYHTAQDPRSIGRFEEAQPWLYNPGANYCNYYK